MSTQRKLGFDSEEMSLSEDETNSTTKISNVEANDSSSSNSLADWTEYLGLTKYVLI